MKNLVIKTIIITLISFIVAIALAFAVLFFSAPGFLGKIFDGAGFDSASVFFYEKQYNNTKSIDDLNTLVLKIDLDDNSEMAEKYYKLILEHSDFDSLVEKQSIENNVSSDFYASQYTLALAKNNKLSSAVEYAKDYCGNSYSQNNPFRVLIYDYLSGNSPIEIKMVADALNSIQLTDKVQVQLKNGDALYLYNLTKN